MRSRVALIGPVGEFDRRSRVELCPASEHQRVRTVCRSISWRGQRAAEVVGVFQNNRHIRGVVVPVQPHAVLTTLELLQCILGEGTTVGDLVCKVVRDRGIGGISLRRVTIGATRNGCGVSNRVICAACRVVQSDIELEVNDVGSQSSKVPGQGVRRCVVGRFYSSELRSIS